MSTINKYIGQGITLGPGNYPSPLTITNAGSVVSNGEPTGEGGAAVYGDVAGVTLVNQGSVIGNDGDGGVDLIEGGSINNSGLISGEYVNIFLGAAAAITNSGMIELSKSSIIGFSADIEFVYGGSLTNLAGGYINHGVEFLNDIASTNYPGTVTNFGTIDGTDTIGVALNEGGTVVDSGTIEGATVNVEGEPLSTVGLAIYFGGTFIGSIPTTNLLDLEAGYSIIGGAEGSNIPGSTNTVELTGSATAPVTVNFTPTSFTNFNNVEFAAGEGNYGKVEFAAAADIPATVTGFTGVHDTIDLGFISDSNNDATAVLNPNNDVLTVTGDNGSTTVQLNPSGDYSGLTFQTSPDGNGTDVSPACFCVGCLIATPKGPAAVEDLVIGDAVMTTSGAVRLIKWIGLRRLAARFCEPLKAWPVRIRAGALADNVPSRDLLLSPDHALLIDDVLIQAGALVNGSSIVRETNVPETFVYYHVELEDHSLIFAENTPSETFVDNVNRRDFDNWAEYEALYPGGKPIVEMPYPRAKAHRQVPRAIRERLADRAAMVLGVMQGFAA
jgi:Hint domain